MEKMLVEKNVGRARSLAGAESAGEGELRKYSRFTPTDRYIYIGELKRSHAERRTLYNHNVHSHRVEHQRVWGREEKKVSSSQTNVDFKRPTVWHYSQWTSKRTKQVKPTKRTKNWCDYKEAIFSLSLKNRKIDNILQEVAWTLSFFLFCR